MSCQVGSELPSQFKSGHKGPVKKLEVEAFISASGPEDEPDLPKAALLLSKSARAGERTSH